MAVLVVIGILVVVFGGLVLLRFPERPGGKIAWHGFEVSSVGAGLPLIVVGVAAIAAGGLLDDDNQPSSPTTQRQATTGAAAEGDCLASFLADVDPERKTTLAAPAIGEIVIGPSEAKRGAIGLRFTDHGQSLGAMRLSYDPASMTFMIDQLVGASCEPLATSAYESLSGDVDGLRNTLLQYDDLRIGFDSRAYVLNLGGGADIRFGFSRFRT